MRPSSSMTEPRPTSPLPLEGGASSGLSASPAHVPLTGTADSPAGRPDRRLFIRSVPYRCSVPQPVEPLAERSVPHKGGTALALNIGPGGLLLLVREAFAASQILWVLVPTGVTGVGTPTLVEVRWSTPMSMAPDAPFHLVGARFLL